MPFNIKELFLEIIKYHYANNEDEYCYSWRCPDVERDINFNKYYQYIPFITRLNSISKIHYEWMKPIKSKTINQIKHSLIWFNAQPLRKTINRYSNFNSDIIEDWACCSIDQTAVEYTVLLYNQLHCIKIKGEYSSYNLRNKFTYPDEFDRRYKILGEQTSFHKQRDYKKFPILHQYSYEEDENYYYYGYYMWNKKGFNKMTKKELQLLLDKPYLFTSN